MSTTTSQGEEERDESVEGAEEAAAQAAKAERSERMRQLAKRRWEVRAEELERQRLADEAAAEDPGNVLFVTVPVAVAPIVKELRRKAASGDVSASKELRAWIDAYPADDSAGDYTQLDRAKRQLFARWLASQEGESPANEGNREGTIDGFDAPPAVPPPSPARDGTPAAEGTAGEVTALETPQTPAVNA